jgi:hypothetical protein
MKSDFIYNPVGFDGHVHASSICEHNGEIYTAWYAYKEKEHEGGQIVVSKYNKTTGDWPKGQFILKSTQGASTGNPVIFSYQGSLHIFFVILKSFYWDSAEIYHVQRDEATKEWGSINKVNTPEAMMIRHRPLVINGKGIVPAYDEKSMSTVLYEFTNEPANWSKYSEFEGQYIQGDLIAFNDMEWQMYLRCAGENNKVMKALSTNKGLNWDFARETNLHCPLSGIAAIKLDSGNIIVCNNNTEKHQRWPLSLSISISKGAFFEPTWDVDTSEIELSYPSLLQSSDGKIHLTYTYNRKMIKHIELTEEELLEKCKEGA